MSWTLPLSSLPIQTLLRWISYPRTILQISRLFLLSPSLANSASTGTSSGGGIPPLTPLRPQFSSPGFTSSGSSPLRALPFTGSESQTNLDASTRTRAAWVPQDATEPIIISRRTRMSYVSIGNIARPEPLRRASDNLKELTDWKVLYKKWEKRKNNLPNSLRSRMFWKWSEIFFKLPFFLSFKLHWQ